MKTNDAATGSIECVHSYSHICLWSTEKSLKLYERLFFRHPSISRTLQPPVSLISYSLIRRRKNYFMTFSQQCTLSPSEITRRSKASDEISWSRPWSCPHSIDWNYFSEDVSKILLSAASRLDGCEIFIVSKCFWNEYSFKLRPWCSDWVQSPSNRFLFKILLSSKWDRYRSVFDNTSMQLYIHLLSKVHTSNTYDQTNTRVYVHYYEYERQWSRYRQ